MFDNRFKYIRKGVAQSKSSFLDCILEASGDSKIKNLDEADRIKYVEKKRKALATKIEINSGYQSNWGMSKDDISSLILNMNIYMDPARFCEILEDVYKVNIYLYKRDEETSPMGSILYKRVKFADMERSSKYDNTVCIFEHMGSESDRAKYPMCEIIGQWQANEGENVYLFPHTHSVARGAEWFDRNGQKYYRSQAVQMPFGELPFAEIIKSQIVDTYGKTRGFIVSYEDEPVVVAVNIMPNFNMNTEDMYDGMDYLSYTCSWDVVKAFLQKYDLDVYRIFSVDGETSLGIETSFETVKMRIKTVAPVDDIIRTFDTENDSRSNPFSDAQESILGLYVKNRRYATILKCLFLKEFSMFMKNYDILNVERDDIFKFVKERILIDQAYKYSDISIYLDKNKSFYKKNKLVVNSRELLIRLVYFLRIYAMRHPTLLREYHVRNICDGFYSDLMDYTITPGTIVFSNSRSLLMMNRGVPDILQIQEVIVPGVHTMIIKNPDIEGGNIVKIDLAESYDDAVRKVGGSSGFYATKPGHSVIKMGESPNILAVRDDYTTYYYTLHVL